MSSLKAWPVPAPKLSITLKGDYCIMFFESVPIHQ